MGEEKCRQEIALLPLAELVYSGIAGRTLDSTIPAHIVVVAVSVFFAIRFVVFVLVADQVAKREPVMTSDEIQTRSRAATVVGIEIAAPGQPAGKFSNRTAIAFPKTSDTVAIFAVPLGPQHRKITYLISSWAKIPGFRH